MGHKVEFFLEIGSPYSYMAATQVAGLVERTGAEVVWKPFLLGAVFKSIGSVLPASIPAKGIYMLRDLGRWTERYGVDFAFPSAFPINSLRAHRGILAAGAHAGDEALERATMALYRAYWVDGKDVSGADVVLDVLSDAGFEREALEALMGDQAVKDVLRSNTDEAIDRGVFGAPTFFVGDEMFWGNDRLDFVEALLS